MSGPREANQPWRIVQCSGGPCKSRVRVTSTRLTPPRRTRTTTTFIFLGAIKRSVAVVYEPLLRTNDLQRRAGLFKRAIVLRFVDFVA